MSILNILLIFVVCLIVGLLLRFIAHLEKQEKEELEKAKEEAKSKKEELDALKTKIETVENLHTGDHISSFNDSINILSELSRKNKK